MSEGTEGRSVDGTILYFKQLFVFEAIDNAEQSFRSSRRDRRTSAILFRQATSKRGCQGIFRFSLKSKNASKKKTKTKKCAGSWRKFVDLCIRCVELILVRPAKKFSKGNAVAACRQVNRPDVVQRDVCEKGMHAQGSS